MRVVYNDKVQAFLDRKKPKKDLASKKQHINLNIPKRISIIVSIVFVLMLTALIILSIY